MHKLLDNKRPDNVLLTPGNVNVIKGGLMKRGSFFALRNDPILLVLQEVLIIAVQPEKESHEYAKGQSTLRYFVQRKLLKQSHPWS